MVAVDGSARPGDVVVAHMPMWAHIYDAPPIMLFEPVAREIGAELGKGLRWMLIERVGYGVTTCVCA